MATLSLSKDHGLEVSGPFINGQSDILTDQALGLVAMLEKNFGQKRKDLIKARQHVQDHLDKGGSLDFLKETANIRASDWRVRPAPEDLQERTLEITGPVDRKMVINALNAGTNCFMADFEDSSSPTWSVMINGQINLKDANSRTIHYTDDRSGKEYALGNHVATLLVRPRGLHMEEAHVTLNREPVSASFFDFALYLIHNAATTARNGSGPYYYLPKMEHHLEARLWNDVICAAEEALGLERGTVRCTVLIETITAAFQMDEILFELKDHIVGLNCGRWDYIFNFIKRFANRPTFVLPNRDEVTMTRHFLRSYSKLLIKTCHRRGAHAMGGMAAQIPIKNDEKANAEAMEKVRKDKAREAGDGHDGTWVAHPGLVPLVKETFAAVMKGKNQLHVAREDVEISAADLLKVPEGTITEEGIRRNITIGLHYSAAWLDGTGCVPIFNLMEDAATAEISRTQLWQWRVHSAVLDDGRQVTAELLHTLLSEEVASLKAARPDLIKIDDAVALFTALVMDDHLEEFLTTPAYKMICASE